MLISGDGLVRSAKEASKPSPGVGEAGSREGYAFRFVEVGEPSQSRDEDARSVIRSHVMRDFYDRRDRRRRPSTVPENTSAASKKDGAAQHTHRFKVGPQGLQEIKKRRRKCDSVPQKPEAAIPVSAKPREASKATVRTQFLQPSNSSKQLGQSNISVSGHCIDHTAGTTTGIEIWPEAVTDHAGNHSHQQAQSKYDGGLALPPAGFPMGLDPFNTLPGSRSPRTQVLLYHGESSPFPASPYARATAI